MINFSFSFGLICMHTSTWYRNDGLASKYIMASQTMSVTKIQVILHMYNALSFFQQDGYTPLYLASEEDHPEVVDILLKNGADPNLATEV